MKSERVIDRALRMARAAGLNQSAFAAHLGVSPQVVTNWKARTDMPAEHYERAAEVLRCSVDALLDRRQSGQPVDLEADADFVAIRRVQFTLSATATGFAIEYLDDDDGRPIVFRREWFSSRGFRPDKLFAVRVANESMRPGLWPGDTVVVNTGDTDPRDGEVFAVNYEGELVIKRLMRDAGRWWLVSDNPDTSRYPRKACSDHVYLIGRVVHKQSEHI